MIRSGRVFASFWRLVAKTKREPVAKAIVHCPCGRDSRVWVYEARTRRRETSPDLIGYVAVPQREEPAEGE